MAAGDGEVAVRLKDSTDMARKLSTKAKIIAALAVVVGVAMAGGGASWIYINLIKDDPPPKLSFELRDQQLSSTVP
jgi:hypothetical protein